MEKKGRERAGEEKVGYSKNDRASFIQKGFFYRLQLCSFLMIHLLTAEFIT